MKARAMWPWMPHCSGPLTDAICTDVAWPLSPTRSCSGDRLLSLRCTLTQKGDSITLHMQPWWSGVSELYYLPISGPGPHSAHYAWKWWFVSVQKEDQRIANVKGLHSANNASDRTQVLSSQFGPELNRQVKGILQGSGRLNFNSADARDGLNLDFFFFPGPHFKQYILNQV